MWWRGECGHSWQLSVRTRAFNDAGCPHCGRRLALEGFNSAECPDAGILHLWHPAKNGDLKPSQVFDRTAKRIWLQCSTCGCELHENLRGTRKESRKCPSCHGERGRYLAKGSNDLGSKRPDVARQLDPELNGGLRAEGLHAHAGVMVWWRGSCGHVWREKVSMRSMRIDDSCPYCKNRKLLRGFNDLATTHPELAAEWDFERNGDLGPDGVRFNATKQVWWRGSCGHEWQMSPRQRAAADPGCPYCSGHRVLAGFNDLATTHPDIAAMWHPRMNKRLKPTGVQAISRKLAWWRGACGHVYRMAVRDRVRAKPGYCPYCSGRKRPERPIRLDWPSAPRRGRNGGRRAYRRDFANIGLGGYAWRLWGSASFSMAAWVAGAWRRAAGSLAGTCQSVEPFDLTGMEVSRKLREPHSLQIACRYAAQVCGNS